MDEIQLTQHFIDSNPSISEAFSCLKPGTELSLIILSNHRCRLYYKNNKIIFEEKAAIDPDIELSINNEAIRRLEGLSGESLTQLGIDLLREISADHIGIKLKSSITKLISRGYLKIIKIAGPEFTKSLASYGLGSIRQLLVVLKHLRKN